MFKVQGEMIPLGSGQRLADIPDNQYYIHLRPAPPSPPRSPPSLPPAAIEVPRVSSNKRLRATAPEDGRAGVASLNPPLFIFSSPSSVERLALSTELRDMVEMGVVASLNHFVIDASFADLRRGVEGLRPGGIHIAAHVAQGDGEPRFVFRDDSGDVIRRGGSGSASSGGYTLGPSPDRVQPLMTAAPPHTTVPFADLVSFLKPFGVLHPGGFVEYVFVNACCSEALLEELTAQCGIPFAFGWSTKAIDSGCFAFVSGPSPYAPHTPPC